MQSPNIYYLTDQKHRTQTRLVVTHPNGKEEDLSYLFKDYGFSHDVDDYGNSPTLYQFEDASAAYSFGIYKLNQINTKHNIKLTQLYFKAYFKHIGKKVRINIRPEMCNCSVIYKHNIMSNQDPTKTDFGFDAKANNYTRIFKFETLDDAFEFGDDYRTIFNKIEIWFYAAITEDNCVVLMKSSKYISEYYNTNKPYPEE